MNESIMQLVTWHYVSFKNSANYVSLGHVDVEYPLGVRNGYATN